MSSASMPKHPGVRSNVRASLILARLDWIKKNHGDAAIATVLEGMSRSHADVVRGVVTPSLWVPFDVFIAFSEAIDAVLGRGDLGLIRPLARHSAKVNLPTLYRIFYKVGSLEYILSKAAAVWTSHYDSGSARAENIRNGHRFHIERFATPHKIHCLTLCGWAEETGVLVGVAIQPVVHSSCRLNGAETCAFDILYA